MGGTRQRWWTVGELAKAAGVTVRALHHYDRTGLLPCASRTASGHRRYSERDVVRLYHIVALRELGFALPEIREVLADEGPAALLATARLHRQRIDEQLGHLRQLRQGLDGLVDRLDELVHRLEGGDTAATDAMFDTLERMTMVVQLTQIYTRQGDDGQTHLADEHRVSKTDPHVEAIGDIDELTAAIGIALATPGGLSGHHLKWLRQIQNDLFDLGADVVRPDASPPTGVRVDARYVARLERHCDQANADLTPLRSFVLPGGALQAAQLHLCRTVCRRAERRVLAVPGVDPQAVRYLNRLSDLLFILSRTANDAEAEQLWQPGDHPDA